MCANLHILTLLLFTFLEFKLSYDCKNWKCGKDQMKDELGVAWHEKLLFEASK
jgi:hypothetical protein